MFTRKKRTPKNDLVGVFRNIFTNDRANDNTQPFQEPQKKKDNMKTSLKRKLKFPSFRVPGTLQWRKEASSVRLSPERRGLYNAITSPGFGFEGVDLSVSVSSILKNPNTERLSYKKRLRFSDDSILNNISSSTEDVLKSNDSTINDTALTQLDSPQSDVEYYTNMKVQMLERNKEFCNKKVKRCNSSKSNSYKTLQKRQQEDDDYFLQSQQLDDPSKIPSPEGSIRDSTYIICSNANILQPSFWTPDNSINDYHGSEMLSKPLCLQKWVSDSDVKCTDVSSPSDDLLSMIVNQSESISGDLSMMLDSNNQFHYDRQTQHNLRSKMPLTKKYKKNRFDPLSKNETCGVAMLRNQKSTSSAMSWGSV